MKRFAHLDLKANSFSLFTVNSKSKDGCYGFLGAQVWFCHLFQKQVPSAQDYLFHECRDFQVQNGWNFRQQPYLRNYSQSESYYTPVYYRSAAQVCLISCCSIWYISQVPGVYWVVICLKALLIELGIITAVAYFSFYHLLDLWLANFWDRSIRVRILML